MSSKAEYKVRREALEKLRALFKEKGLFSTIEKRAIILEVLGCSKTLASLKCEEMELISTYLNDKDTSFLQSTFIGWFYMNDLEDGLTKKQLRHLMSIIPANISLYPVSLNDVTELEANSNALGFINNDYYEDLAGISSTLAKVCNDWSNESKDFIYEFDDQKIYMFCDFRTEES